MICYTMLSRCLYASILPASVRTVHPFSCIDQLEMSMTKRKHKLFDIKALNQLETKMFLLVSHVSISKQKYFYSSQMLLKYNETKKFCFISDETKQIFCLIYFNIKQVCFVSYHMFLKQNKTFI